MLKILTKLFVNFTNDNDFLPVTKLPWAKKKHAAHLNDTSLGLHISVSTVERAVGYIFHSASNYLKFP